MICVLSLIVFSLLGIFSASYRDLAKEAFDCVFRRVTLRPCNTGFQEKVTSRVLSAAMRISPKLAKFIKKYMEVIAFFFIALLFVSFAYIVYGLANYYLYGNCNGQNSDQFCVLDPKNTNNQITAIGPSSCGTNVKHDPSVLTLSPIDLSKYPTLGNGKKQIVFMGSFTCRYTRAAYPLMKRLVNENPDSIFTFVHYPIDDTSKTLHAYNFCANKLDSSKYWSFYDKVFTEDVQKLTNTEFLQQLLKDSGYDVAAVESCVKSGDTTDTLIAQIDAETKTNIYGTPIVFINGKPLVGPKPFRVYSLMIGNPFSW